MAEPKVLDLQLSPELVERVTAFLRSVENPSPTLCLMKGRTAGADLEPHWSYGSYGPENVQSLEPALAQRGHPLLYRVGELVVAIPQFQLVPELVGKTLALSDARLVVLPRA